VKSLKSLSLLNGRTRFRLMDLAVLPAAGLLVAQAPSSVSVAAWVPDLDALTRIALGGLLTGYILERTRVAAPFGLLIGTVLGFEVITWIYAQTAPAGSISERVDWLGSRVGAWYDAVGSGGVSNDPIVFALAMAVLAWLLGLITAWLIFR